MSPILNRSEFYNEKLSQKEVDDAVKEATNTDHEKDGCKVINIKHARAHKVEGCNDQAFGCRMNYCNDNIKAEKLFATFDGVGEFL